MCSSSTAKSEKNSQRKMLKTGLQNFWYLILLMHGVCMALGAFLWKMGQTEKLYNWKRCSELEVLEVTVIGLFDSYGK